MLKTRLGLAAMATLAAGLEQAAAQPAALDRPNVEQYTPGVVVPPKATPGSLATRNDMTGDWYGYRTKLHDAGYDFKASYVGEYAANLSGGKSNGEGYAQQLAFGVDIDLSKATHLDTGTISLLFDQREGRSVSSDYTGNKLAVQEIYGAGNNFRVEELSYKRDLFNKEINFKVGYYPLGNDFATLTELCDYQNLGFCGHAQSLPNNSGWSDYPSSRWGGRVRINGPGQTYLQIGAFDVNPTYSLHDNGLKFGLSGSTGVIVPVEVVDTFAIGPGKLVGHLRVGGYYDTSRAADTANASIEHTGRYGGWVLADLMVMSFKPGTDRGLVILGNVTRSDNQTAKIPTYWLGGVEARGLFDSRPNDYMAFGYIRAQVNHRAEAAQAADLIAEGVVDPGLADAETVVELDYGWKLTPWLLLHPNVQYIGDPGTFTYKVIPSAWVAGMQIKARL